MALRATGGEIYYLADAGLEHRRTGDDSRLRRAGAGRVAPRAGRAPHRQAPRQRSRRRHRAAQRGRRRLAHRAAPLPPGADHRSALGRAAGRGAARPVSAPPATDDFLSGESGSVAGPRLRVTAHAGRRRALARRAWSRSRDRGSTAWPPGRRRGGCSCSGCTGPARGWPERSRGCAPSATTCAWRWAPPPTAADPALAGETVLTGLDGGKFENLNLLLERRRAAGRRLDRGHRRRRGAARAASSTASWPSASGWASTSPSPPRRPAATPRGESPAGGRCRWRGAPATWRSARSPRFSARAARRAAALSRAALRLGPGQPLERRGARARLGPRRGRRPPRAPRVAARGRLLRPRGGDRGGARLPRRSALRARQRGPAHAGHDPPAAVVSGGCACWWCPSGTRGPSARCSACSCASTPGRWPAGTTWWCWPRWPRRRPTSALFRLTDEVEDGLRTMRVRYRRPWFRPAAMACQVAGLLAALWRLRRDGLQARRGARPRVLGRAAGAAAGPPERRGGGGHRALHGLPARPDHGRRPLGGVGGLHGRRPGGARERGAGRPPARDRAARPDPRAAERGGHRGVRDGRARAPRRARRGCSRWAPWPRRRATPTCSTPSRGCASDARPSWTWWATASCDRSWRRAPPSWASTARCASTASCPRRRWPG